MNAGRRARAAIPAVQAAMRVPGAPLAPRERAEFETAFGCDLSHVRVHKDELAAAAAQAVQARAFAVGRDLFFAAGAYEPQTARGRTVIAHEIAHALQDPRPIEAAELAGLTEPGDAAEAGADNAVASLAGGRRPAALGRVGPAPRVARLLAGLLDRRPADDPAQLVARLAETVRVTFAADPDDRIGRIRRTLLRLDDRTRRLVFERLESELASADWRRLIETLDQPAPEGAESSEARELPPEPAPAEQAKTETPPEAAKAETPEAKPPQASATKPEIPEAEAPKADAKAGKPESQPQRRAPQGGKARPALPGRGAGRRAPARGPAVAAPTAEAAAPEPAALAELAPVETAQEPEDAAGESTTETEAATPSDAGRTEEAPEPAPAPAAEAAPQATPSAPAPQAEADAAPPTASESPQPSTTDGEADDGPAAERGEAAPVADAGAEPATAEAENAEDAPRGEGPVAPGNEAASPSAAAPPAGDLPSEQDDGREDGGGGGGGGGGAVSDQPEEPAPAPAADAEPAAAMASAADLAPAQMQRALGGVASAVGRTVAADHAALAATPPEATPPAAPPGGAPARSRESAPGTPAPIARIAEGAAGRAAAPVAQAGPSAPIPEVHAPAVTSNAEGQITAEDAQGLAEGVEALPVADPALNVTVGAAPALALDAAADPGRAASQSQAVARATEGAAEAGRRDAAEPAGEAHIVPTLAPETVRGEVPAGRAAAAATAPAADVDPGVAAVARERSGDTVRAAALSAAQDLSGKRAEQQTRMTDARASSQRDMDRELAENAALQQAARGAAQREVQASRGQWTAEQRTVVRQADGDSRQRAEAAGREAVAEQGRATTEARGHIVEGDRAIASVRAGAEAQARAERERARNESRNSGLLSRLASAIGSFFDRVRRAIHAAFEAARKAVADAIATAQRLAAAAIDRARAAIVGLIRLAGDAIIAIGDRALAAFPALRDRFRTAIHGAVERATAAVNRLAESLKRGVKALLDLLGKALTAILDAYEALYMAAVNVVASAITSAINAARAAIQAFATFAQLVRDIASNPGQWLRNLGRALYDGVRNHLWKALKAAIKEWFNSKVEAVVGVGRLIFDVLRKGGIPFRRIASMVWVAVKAAIPRAIIEFLIQRVVSMLIPAAAAVMAIIEGLQAAWATASRVIAAIERFVAFLKAVKGGNAGPQFAAALAAAAVAVIDFTANFILSKIAKGAKGVGSRLKGIANRLMAFFRRGAAAARRGLGRVRAAIVGAARAVGRGLRRAGQWVARSRLGQGLRRAGRWLARTRLGRAAGRVYQGAQRRVQDARERFRQWRERRRQDKARDDSQRLERAVTALRPRLAAMLARGVGRVRLALTLAGWRLFYRLKRLGLDGDRIVAANSPPVDVASFVSANAGELHRLIHDAAQEVLNDPAVQAERDRFLRSEQRAVEARAGLGSDSAIPTAHIGSGPGLLGFGLALRAGDRPSGFRQPHTFVSTPFNNSWAMNFQQSVRGTGGVRIGAGRFPGSSNRRINYDALMAEMRDFRKRSNPPISDSQFAGHVARFASTGRAGGPFEGAHAAMLMSDFSTIAFGAEVARSTSFAAEGPMLMSLVQSNRLTPEQAFSRASAVNPMSMAGAAAANRLFEARVQGLPENHASSRARTVYAEVQRRRLALLTAYIENEMRGEVFKDEAAFLAWARETLRPLVVARARRFFALPTAGAPNVLPNAS